MTDPIANRPLSLLTTTERRQLLDALDWLAAYRDTEEVAALMRTDGPAQHPSLADLPEEAWQVLADVAMECIVLPVAIEVRESLP